MNGLRRNKWFSLNCPVVHIVYLEFCGVWVLSLFWMMLLKKTLPKTKGPQDPSRSWSRGAAWTCRQDCPQGRKGMPQVLGRGRAVRDDSLWLVLLATPQCSVVLTTCWQLSKVNRSKLTSQPLQSSAGILTCPLGLDFCFKYLRFFLSPSTGVSAPRTAPCIWDAIHPLHLGCHPSFSTSTY